MRDRASTFDSPRVVGRLQERFVPVAIDSWAYRHGEGETARLYVAVAREAKLNRVNDDGGRSYQGHYVLTPSGRLLAAHNRRGEEAALELMERSLRAWDALPAGERGLAAPADEGGPRNLFDPALVLNVYSRISGWDEESQESTSGWRREMDRTNRERAGLDHLWLTALDERLVRARDRAVGERWSAPVLLARRIARFHLVDNVRGEPDHYGRGDVETAAIDLVVESREGDRVTIGVSGRFAMARGGEYPTRYEGRLEGRLVRDTRADRWVRFDLLARGRTAGRGRWTPGAPAGEFDLVVAIELPPDDFAVAVPPQGMRSVTDYRMP